MPRHVHPDPLIIRPPQKLVSEWPHLQRASHALSLKYADRKVVTEKELQDMGTALWRALDVQKEFAAARTSAGAAILSVIIESSAAEIQALPWETLYHPELGFIGKHAGLTLTRRIKAEQTAPQPLEKGPLRVLLFTSLPDDVDPEKERLNVEEEQAQVQEALLPWISEGLLQLEMPDDGRFSTLQALLKSFHPHILFLSGHGRFFHQPHSGEAPFGEFLFESESGDSAPVKDDQIAAALVGMGVQAVVLSACESSKAASDALNDGLTRRISAQGIPHVIGMRESILDIAGIQFARTLCDELARRERIDTALQSARLAIQTPLAGIERREAGLDAAEELSLGQWCLPMLLSANPQYPLIDWDFAPKQIERRFLTKRLNKVSLPERFVGRRAEMRRYQSDLLKAKLQKLLITGPGGQGKTSLAGKLALDLQQHGYQIFAWSARPENPWRQFELELEMALDQSRSEQYDRLCARVKDEKERAQWLLRFLTEQFNGRLVLFFDNLETQQDEQSLQWQDPVVAAWIQTAQNTDGLILFATSRWKLPGWPGEHLLLERANYGDYLQMVQRLAVSGRFSRTVLQNRSRLRKVYDVLGGNCRGLEFFAAATLGMQNAEEETFLHALSNTKKELQANMAIKAIYQRLPKDTQQLLQRLPVYTVPVPAEGFVKLGLDLSDPEMLLERLLDVSLLEAQYEAHWDVMQYQCVSMVTDWLNENGLLDEAPERLSASADYLLYLFHHERGTVNQAMTAHDALRRAGRDNEADRLTLDFIVGPLTTAGLYATLLDKWLPKICESKDSQTRGEALGQTGKLHLHIGDYPTALTYLKQSLAIRQQIGDKKGEGVTLNNISQIYDAQGDYQTALTYLKQSLAIRQQIGDKAGEGVTLNNISQIYDAQGDYPTALTYLKQSLAISQQIGDKAGEGVTLNNISQIYDAQGDYQTALTYLKQSLAISQQIGDKQGEGATLNNISQIYDAQGDYQTALTYLKQSLAIRQQIGDKAGEGVTLNNISQIYRAQGDYQTALTYLKQSLAIRQQIGDKKGEGTTLNNIAGIYRAQGDYQTALTYLKQSLTIYQQIGDKAGEGVTLNNISQIYHAQGDYQTALTYLKQSLAIRQQIGDKAGLCATLFNMGHIHAQNSKMQEAISTWLSVYKIAKQINEAQVLQALANLAPQLGLPKGLAGWENLAQKIQNGTGEDGDT